MSKNVALVVWLTSPSLYFPFKDALIIHLQVSNNIDSRSSLFYEKFLLTWHILWFKKSKHLNLFHFIEINCYVRIMQLVIEYYM